MRSFKKQAFSLQCFLTLLPSFHDCCPACATMHMHESHIAMPHLTSAHMAGQTRNEEIKGRF